MSEPQWVSMNDYAWGLLLFDQTFAFNKLNSDKFIDAGIKVFASVQGQSGQRVFPVSIATGKTDALLQFRGFCEIHKDITRRYSRFAIDRVETALRKAVVDNESNMYSDSAITLEEDCELVDASEGRRLMRMFQQDLPRSSEQERERYQNRNQPKPKPAPLPTPTKRRFKK